METEAGCGDSGADDIEFGEQDLLEALLAAQIGPDGIPGALTMRELKDRLGVSQQLVTKLLTRLKCQGRLEVIRLRREALDGRMLMVPGYRLKRPAHGGESSDRRGSGPLNRGTE